MSNTCHSFCQMTSCFMFWGFKYILCIYSQYIYWLCICHLTILCLFWVIPGIVRAIVACKSESDSKLMGVKLMQEIEEDKKKKRKTNNTMIFNRFQKYILNLLRLWLHCLESSFYLILWGFWCCSHRDDEVCIFSLSPACVIYQISLAYKACLF